MRPGICKGPTAAFAAGNSSPAFAISSIPTRLFLTTPFFFQAGYNPQIANPLGRLFYLRATYSWH